MFTYYLYHNTRHGDRQRSDPVQNDIIGADKATLCETKSPSHILLARTDSRDSNLRVHSGGLGCVLSPSDFRGRVLF